MDQGGIFVSRRDAAHVNFIARIQPARRQSPVGAFASVSLPVAGLLWAACSLRGWNVASAVAVDEIRRC